MQVKSRDDATEAAHAELIPNNTAVIELNLTAFRSYLSLKLEVDERPVILTGANGSGKTNVLEALSLLTPGRGLRRAELKDMIYAPSSNIADGAIGVDAKFWAVSALVANHNAITRVGTGVEQSPRGGYRRVVRIDGDRVEGAFVLGHFVRAVWLTPAMDRLFAGGAGVRRRFLDRLVLGHDPEHARRISAFEKAMRERQRLLAEGVGDDAWLTALESTMAEKGAAIAAARVHFVSALGRAALAGVSAAFPSARLGLEGCLEDGVARGAAIDAEDHYIGLLSAMRQRDAEAGRALDGPHRSDLKVWHATADTPAHVCSTGEQKALLIGIVLAAVRLLCAEAVHVPPILLLDEVAAHLDAPRRSSLFGEIEGLGCQTWMTGTDHALFAPFGHRAQHFHVDGARLRLIEV